MSKMNEIRLIIFDMDGLMFDTERNYGLAMERICRKHNVEINIEPFWNIIGTSMPLPLDEMNAGGIDESAFVKLIDQAHDIAIDEMNEHGIPFKKGLLRLLCYAERKGIKMCVGTSTPIEISGRYLENSGVVDYLEFVVTRQEVSHGKPAPDIYLKCCEKAGVSVENALVIEDTNNGCLAAANGGIPYIMVPDLQKPDDEIRKKALAVVSSLDEVISFI